MIRWTWCGLTIAVLALACDSPQQKPVAGGSTEDFNGQDNVECETGSQVALDEESPLGFAPRVALELIEGNFALDITWDHPCAPDLACRSLACADGGLAFVDSELSGQPTVLRVAIHATGAPARVRFDAMNSAEPSCAQSMQIPVLVRLTTDDGMLDEHFQSDILTNDGQDATFVIESATEQLRGALSRTLAESATVEIALNVHQTAAGMATLRLGVLIGGRAGFSKEPLLAAFLDDAVGCSDKVSRDIAIVP